MPGEWEVKTDGNVVAAVARKDDTDKLDWSLLPWGTLRSVVWVYQMGAKKYGKDNYKAGLDYSRVYSAMIRHLTAWWGGETYDPVDGQHHLSSVVWCALTLMYYQARGVGKDDRPS